MRFPGDDAQSARMRPPELIAAEQRVLTYADALVTWMRETDFGPDDGEKLNLFFTAHAAALPVDNPAGSPLEYPGTSVKAYMLERLDPDANRLFLELLRAAWELRCWQVRQGERPKENLR